MHHLEHIVLIENVLGSAVVGDEAVLADMLRRAGVEVEIEGNGIELRIEVDAMIGKAKRGLRICRACPEAAAASRMPRTVS
jgi:hypothetical protein